MKQQIATAAATSDGGLCLHRLGMVSDYQSDPDGIRKLQQSWMYEIKAVHSRSLHRTESCARPCDTFDAELAADATVWYDIFSIPKVVVALSDSRPSGSKADHSSTRRCLAVRVANHTSRSLS